MQQSSQILRTMFLAQWLRCDAQRGRTMASSGRELRRSEVRRASAWMAASLATHALLILAMARPLSLQSQSPFARPEFETLSPVELWRLAPSEGSDLRRSTTAFASSESHALAAERQPEPSRRATRSTASAGGARQGETASSEAAPAVVQSSAPPRTATEQPSAPDQEPSRSEVPLTVTSPSALPSRSGARLTNGHIRLGAPSPHAYLSIVRASVERQRHYPLLARRRRIEGTAVISFGVARSGSVGELKVLKSSGHEALDQAAVDAVRGAGRFPPIPPDLGLERVTLEIPMVFKIVSTPSD